MEAVATLMQTGTMILGGLLLIGVVIVTVYLLIRRATALKGA